MIFLLHSVNVRNDFLTSQGFWGRSDGKCPIGDKSCPAENSIRHYHTLKSINQLNHLEIQTHWCSLKFIDAIVILTFIYQAWVYIWREGFKCWPQLCIICDKDLVWTSASQSEAGLFCGMLQQMFLLSQPIQTYSMEIKTQESYRLIRYVIKDNCAPLNSCINLGFGSL